MNRTVTMLAMYNLSNETGVRIGAARLIKFIEQFNYQVTVERTWDGQPASLPGSDLCIVRLCRIQKDSLRIQNARRCAELGHLCIVEEDGEPRVVGASGSLSRKDEEFYTQIVEFLERRADRQVRMHQAS